MGRDAAEEVRRQPVVTITSPPTGWPQSHPLFFSRSDESLDPRRFVKRIENDTRSRYGRLTGLSRLPTTPPSMATVTGLWNRWRDSGYDTELSSASGISSGSRRECLARPPRPSRSSDMHGGARPRMCHEFLRIDPVGGSVRPLFGPEVRS